MLVYMTVKRNDLKQNSVQVTEKPSQCLTGFRISTKNSFLVNHSNQLFVSLLW